MLPLHTSHLLARSALGATRRFSSTPTPAAAVEIKKLGVIGAGQMGLGIALVASQKAGVDVRLIDSSDASLSKGLRLADTLLEKQVGKKKITQDEADIVRTRLKPSLNIEDVSDVDFVVEAVPEIPSLKDDIFSKLASICAPHVILGSNTSSVSITTMAAAAQKASNDPSAASRVIGTHFMNPVPFAKGVEIINGLQTSPSTVTSAVNFCERMGKIVSHSTDVPGFICNRILLPGINEAAFLLEQGVGTKEDIDGIMENGPNQPMGPLKLADFIGIDTCYAIMKVMHDQTGDTKYRPAGIMKRMIDAGWLGKKSGKGFYEY